MNRRQFLAFSAAGLGVAALGSAALVYEDREDFVIRLVRQYIGDFQMDPEQQQRFVSDVTARYGDVSTAALIGFHRIRDYTGLGIGYTDQRVDWFERRVVSEFITSTDYLRKQNEANPTVSYFGVDTPCINPYAQFS